MTGIHASPRATAPLSKSIRSSSHIKIHRKPIPPRLRPAAHPAIGTTTRPRSTHTYKTHLSGKPHHSIRSLSSVLKGRHKA